MTERGCLAPASLAGIEGPARAILTGERTALNLLGRLSGIATLTRRYVDARRGHRRDDPRYAQDDSRAARAREVRGALRRRLESSCRPRRRDPAQGEPPAPCRRNRRRAGGASGRREWLTAADDRGRGRDAWRGRRGARGRCRADPARQHAPRPDLSRCRIDRGARAARGVGRHLARDGQRATPRPASTSSRSARSRIRPGRSMSRWRSNDDRRARHRCTTRSASSHKSANAVILAHNYQVPRCRMPPITLATRSVSHGRRRRRTPTTIVFCGVHFMAETAAILAPEKTVLIPDPDAGCSLASSITADELRAWKAEHPGAVVVSYVNTTAEVKAETRLLLHVRERAGRDRGDSGRPRDPVPARHVPRAVARESDRSEASDLARRVSRSRRDQAGRHRALAGGGTGRGTARPSRVRLCEPGDGLR